jgi:hypothetical protein
MEQVSTRRARRPESLAVRVSSVLDELQCPIATPAMRIILGDRGSAVRAEHLSRLAAYQREDFLRTHVPPELCWTIEPDGKPTTPRWWARPDWRLERRIRTEDVSRIWHARLAEWLSIDLSRSPAGRDSAIITLALGSAALALGSQVFDVPRTEDDWVALHEQVYGPYQGALNNRAGVTRQQAEAEIRLISEGRSSFDLLFGAK